MSITISNKLLMEEAQSRGWEAEVLDEKNNLVILRPPKGEEILIRRTRTELSSAVGNYIADQKGATYALAQYYGIPIPETEHYEDFEQAKGFLAEHKKIVVKPVDQGHGDGVTVGITDEAKLEVAIEYAQSWSDDIILQRHYEGNDYRLVVVGGTFIAAAFRQPPFVIGDGSRTVRELIEEKNEHPFRGEGHSSPLTKIKFEEVEKFLGEGSLERVPEKEERLEVLGTANLSRGGEAVDVTDQVHPEIAQMAVMISEKSQLGVAGVDIRCTDISKSAEDSEAVLIEINISPGIRMHHFPSVGEPRNVAGAILDELVGKRS